MTETMSGGPQAAAEQSAKAAGGAGGSFRQVWLAGLGLVAVAGEGISDTFHTLVEKGEAAAPPSRERIKAAGEKVSGLVEPASQKLHAAWTGLSRAVRSYSAKGEGLMDEKIAAALQRMGVPTKEEFQSLREKLDAIAAAITEMKGQTESAEPTHDQPARAGRRQKPRD